MQDTLGVNGRPLIRTFTDYEGCSSGVCSGATTFYYYLYSFQCWWHSDLL